MNVPTMYNAVGILRGEKADADKPARLCLGSRTLTC
jgi:hypothetical protein